MNKWRVFGAFLIIMSLLVMLIPAAEADAETSASAFSIKSGEVVKYNGKERIVSVPDTVTSIGKGAFENNPYVEKVILPDSVKQIRPYAFWGCDNLKTVTLGKGLSTIGDFAFTNCTGLETMTIPTNISSIGIQSFSNCPRFEDITIPPQVFDIKEDAFDGDCLLNIHCEEGSYADKYAKEFYERQKTMTVYGTTGSGGGNGTSTDNSTTQKPSNVPADGVYSGADAQANSTWDGKDQTTGFVIGSTKVVGNQAVVFTQKVGIPVTGELNGDGIASAYVVSGGAVLDEALKNQNGNGQSGTGQGNSGQASNPANTQGGNSSEQPQASVTEVPYASDVANRTHYRDEACTAFETKENMNEVPEFSYARSGLKQLSLPDGVDKIKYAAFYHCDDLVEVELPESVKSVEAKAFAHTPFVENFLAGKTEYATDYLIRGGVLIAYRGKQAEVVVPEGVRVIAGEAFAEHEEMKKITLPTTLEHIDDRAFAGCSPEKIEYLGEKLSKDVVEENVKMQALAKAPESNQKKIPFYIWVIAGVLFVSGAFCIFKERY